MLKDIKIKTVALVIASILGAIGLSLGTHSYYLSSELKQVRVAWSKFNAERSTRYRMLRRLNTALGYDGMIHHFKNYLIRKEVIYLKKSEQAIATANFIVKAYRALGDDAEQQALDSIEQMLEDYSNALVRAEKLIESGENIREIDRQVRVDDGMARDALLLLQHKSSRSGTEGVDDILFESKIRLLNWLRGGMGYSGMIHHFKNYIIRQEVEDLDIINVSFSSLYTALEYYDGLDINKTEQLALQQLLETIGQYEENIILVDQMIDEGKTVEQIDQAIWIDDQPVINAFIQISKVINQQNEHAAEAVKNTLLKIEQGVKARSKFIISILLLSLISIMWLLRNKIIRPILQLTDAMRLLADNRLDTRINIDTGNNEIGSMSRALEVFKDNAIQMVKDAQLIRMIMETVGEGIYGIDIKGRVTFINPKALEMLGWQSDELIERDFHALCQHTREDGSNYPFSESPVSACIEQNQAKNAHDELLWRKNGDSFPTNLTATPLIKDGEVSGAVVLFQDITERKRIDRMKTEFISTVSHELRTPLTAIRGSLGLITGGAVGEVPQKVGELIKIAGNNTERLLMLINDILDVEKIEAGSMSFQFENLLLMPLIEQVLQDNAAYAEQFSVELVLMDRVEDARVTVDQGRLMQVMANLLSNAAKFSLENGKVEISINRRQGDKIRISVTDHGAGIPETFQPKLFDKFTQSDSSDTRQKGGTGLGLSITKAIVEKHNGQIGFKTRQGAGTTFYVDLPGQVVPKIAEELAEKQLHCPAILIIEDDADVAALLKIMLSEAGYNCDIAYCAAEARQLLSDREGDYKAITLDLLLPDEDGIELLQELRRKVATRDIPVVVVSAKADEARLELNGGAMGMADWLNKPIDESRLTDAIKQATDPGRKPRILHVEDDADVHTVVSHILRDSCELTWTTTLADSKKVLESQLFDLVLLDIGLPDGSGLDLLETIEQRVIPPRVVIFSANDVTQQYADKVSAVLMKSKTDNTGLLDVISNIIGDDAAKRS